jgi:hypothetical protein
MTVSLPLLHQLPIGLTIKPIDRSVQFEQADFLSAAVNVGSAAWTNGLIDLLGETIWYVRCIKSALKKYVVVERQYVIPRTQHACKFDIDRRDIVARGRPLTEYLCDERLYYDLSSISFRTPRIRAQQAEMKFQIKKPKKSSKFIFSGETSSP